MLRLGQKVYIVGDKLEMKLPLGAYGFIIAYDKNPDNVFDYVIRIPNSNRHVYVTKEDIELEDVLLKQAIDQVEKEALIDFALATKNEELFQRVLNGEDSGELENSQADLTGQENFIRQVHLKAWI